MWPYRSNREDLVKTVVPHPHTHTHIAKDTNIPRTPGTPRLCPSTTLPSTLFFPTAPSLVPRCTLTTSSTPLHYCLTTPSLLPYCFRSAALLPPHWSLTPVPLLHDLSFTAHSLLLHSSPTSPQPPHHHKLQHAFQCMQCMRPLVIPLL